MGFQEMLQESRERLRAENKQLKSTCKEKVKEIEKEITELEADSQSLRTQRESLGFFKMKKKKELDDILRKYSIQIRKLNEKKNRIISDTDFQVQSNKRKLAIIEGEKGEFVKFGFAPYSGGREPLKWAIISCDNQKLRMICMNTVGLFPYGCATRWLRNEFLEEAFSPQERQAIDPDVSVPTSEESSVNGKRHVTPTEALKKYIIKQQQEDGRRFMYNNLQIQNGIKSQLESSEPYWLVTHNLRDGFANYVGRGMKDDWICARIGSCAEFGVRPVITVDRIELIKI